jgi:peptidoglycan/xylan/chitin deacetylase (PgdA/CDA1 family)
MSKFHKALAFYVLNRFYKNETVIRLREPVISFTFDDVPRSAIENGQAILNKYGFPGTFYISMKLMSEEGFDFKKSDAELLGRIVDKGSELACHTFSHLHFFSSDEKDILSDLQNNQAFIESILPGYRFQNISYPFGEQTLAARKIMKQRFRSARSVYRGLNAGKTDLNCLRSVRLYDTISLDSVFDMIQTAVDKKAWLIFYTHDVMENPSAYGCSPSYFEEVVRHCHDKNLNVLTVNETLDFVTR